jgi:Tfp pilus assembly protein PilF
MIRMAFRRLAPSVLCAAVALAFAATASAQTGVVRGKVVDAQGAPVDGAKVTISAQSVKNTREVKTNKKGEFVQVGLFPGDYTITVEKDKLKATQDTKVSIGDNPPLDFKLAPSAADEQAKKVAALEKVFSEGVELVKAGKHDEAIAKFNEAISQAPNCNQCYDNIGFAHAQRKDWVQAEAAFKKALEIKPDDGNAWGGLVNVYSATDRHDLAKEANAKAAQFNPEGAGAGGGAVQLYNDGVILWNNKEFEQAKAKFVEATKVDPKFAQAYYLLGKANINLGDFAGAVAALETYVQLEPNGEHAEDAKKNIQDLQPLIKK